MHLLWQTGIAEQGCWRVHKLTSRPSGLRCWYRSRVHGVIFLHRYSAETKYSESGVVWGCYAFPSAESVLSIEAIRECVWASFLLYVYGCKGSWSAHQQHRLTMLRSENLGGVLSVRPSGTTHGHQAFAL